jgi:glutathione synthase/RimK-type ligase-like ATP-grasp enzyme
MRRAPVLLWGLENDPPLRAVREQLTERGAQVAFVDHAAVARTRVRVDEGAFTLREDGRTLALDDFAAAYLRPYDARFYGAGVVEAAAGVHHLVYEWAEGATGTIVNRPSAEATNHSKLLQAPAARAVGFATPESLVTNEQEEILAFCDRHGSVIVKSLSSVRSVVAELDRNALPAGAMGPAFVQQRIRGTNVRAHVVADRTFACAIDSTDVDYRYGSAQVTRISLPLDVAAACVALAERLGLLLAGIDLIAGDDGAWYCLEANPSPAFPVFDHDQAIARALADMLASPATS